MLSNISFDVDGLNNALYFLKIKSDPNKDLGIEQGIPAALDILKKENITATFFLVGKNVEQYPEIHKSIAENHEIGSHSYSHNNELSFLSHEKAREEIMKAHNAIKKYVKITPKYFRGPKYQINNYILDLLDKLNYKCDSSFMPAYYPRITPLKNLFLKRKPHRIGKNLIEVPLSVNPIIPLYINGSSVLALGMPWLKFSMNMLKLFKLPLIINFHTEDFIKAPKAITKHRHRLYEDSLPLIKKAINYINKHSKISTLEEIGKSYVQ